MLQDIYPFMWNFVNGKDPEEFKECLKLNI
jgi:hypothetical protein